MKILIPLIIIFSFFSSISDKIPIPDLFNTGVDDQRNILYDGSIDPHYRLISSADANYPGPDAKITLSTGFPMERWFPNDDHSRWIAPRTDAGMFNEIGMYVYRINFDLSKFKSGTAEIWGHWSSDNNGVDILINGKSTGYITPIEAYYGMFPFKIDKDFVDGINTIDFVVYNYNAPTGLRVEINGVAEPKEFASFGIEY